MFEASCVPETSAMTRSFATPTAPRTTSLRALIGPMLGATVLCALLLAPVAAFVLAGADRQSVDRHASVIGGCASATCPADTPFTLNQSVSSFSIR
jgi:hypothetical protein